jgi:hypothetical protein
VPVITVSQGTPVLPPGSYQATLIDVVPKSFPTKYSKNGEDQNFFEWTWDVDGIEITSLTTQATGAKSRINEYLTAMLGKDGFKIGDNIDTDDLIGKQVTLAIIEDNGFSKVDRVVGPMKAPAPKAQPVGKVSPKRQEEPDEAPAIDESMDPGDQDDLPF